MTASADWEGPVGDVWAREWRRTDRSFSNLASHLDAAIRVVAPVGPFAALDIGCGAGATSLALAAARPDATITGVDLSPALIATATERAVGRSNLRFTVGDAVAAAADIAPDLLYSRHGVMFFDDPGAAFTALHAAAVPGAALVFSCFDAVARNEWATLVSGSDPSPDEPGPFAFADPDRVAGILSAAGWRDATPTPVRFDYIAGQGEDPVADALEYLRRIGPAARALRDAPPAGRGALLARLRDALERRRGGDTVAFPAAAWLWSARS